MNDKLSAEDEPRMDVVARNMGLDLALIHYPADIRSAFVAMERLRGALTFELLPSDEPWPPMTVDRS